MFPFIDQIQILSIIYTWNFLIKKNEIPPKKNKRKKRKKKEKGKKKHDQKQKTFSDRIDTIILPLVCLQVQEEFYLPIHHTVYFDCPTVKRQWPVLVYSPSRSIGPGMDNPLNFSETDH